MNSIVYSNAAGSRTVLFPPNGENQCCGGVAISSGDGLVGGSGAGFGLGNEAADGVADVLAGPPGLSSMRTIGLEVLGLDVLGLDVAARGDAPGLEVVEALFPSRSKRGVMFRPPAMWKVYRVGVAQDWRGGEFLRFRPDWGTDSGRDS
jgi:hypothetical protein